MSNTNLSRKLRYLYIYMLCIIRGHPLKGVSREKTPLHEKKSFLFFAWHNVPPQHGAVLPSGSHPLFHVYWFTFQPVLIRTSHPSGSRRLCFKRNTCTSSTMLKTRPLVHSDPRKSSVPYRVQLVYHRSYGC